MLRSSFSRRILLSVALSSIFAAGCQKQSRIGQSPRPIDPRRPSGQVIGKTPQPVPHSPQRSRGNPEWFPRTGKISDRWTTIVLHHSATAHGNAKSFDQYHRAKGWNELGYHFVIGNGTSSGDGVIEMGSRWQSQKHGAHCKSPGNYFNEHGIGICLVGDFNKTRPTQRQMASLRRLVAFLCDQCDIPESRVTTHGLVDNKTECPGRNFPIMSFRRSLAIGAQSGNYPR